MKLYYRLEGWLDIQHGDHVFLEDLEFSDDKTRVTIKIHIEEGERYKIRNLRFEFDPVEPPDLHRGGDLPRVSCRSPATPTSENNANKDVAKIKDKYGERAYIQAEINHNEIVAREVKELDLVYSIKENDKIYVGRLIFEGNSKTREDVLRREFTRTGFLPGEEYNNTSLQRALQRIKDRQLIDAQSGGLQVRTQETDDPQTRDVVLDVKEGQTGTVRFAAGYSSSFGITGLLEFTQRNFDIADLPTSFEDMVGGTGFAGGGQFLRLRVAPAQKRQSYTADFREPYVFGYEFGLGVRAYEVNTLRESYDERREGGAITVDKRLDPFTLQLSLEAYRIAIERIDPNAPLAVTELAGHHSVFTLTPALVYDSRDSIIFPTSGFRLLVSEVYAGQILPGNFDFNKFSVETEGHLTLFETDSHLKHVASFQATFGYGSGARMTPDVPIFERFYAGGRDAPRGFDYRGMGPHENGDPVGGDALLVGTLEYSYPIFVEFLRGAFFYDIGNLTPDIYDLRHEKWRNVVGFGIRFFIPQLGNIPVKLDFGFPHDQARGRQAPDRHLRYRNPVLRIKEPDMLKLPATLVSFLLLAAGAGGAVAQDKDKAPFKLGVVNLRICFDKDKYERVKEVDAELQKLADEYTKRIQEIEKKMAQLQDQISGLPRESKLRADKILQLRRLETDLKFEKEYGKAQYLDFYSDKKIEIYNEVRRVVGLIALEQKYDLILRVESPTLDDQQDPENVTQRINNRVVLYSHESVDLTAVVVERLNSEYKKAKASGGGEKKEGEKKSDGK